ncbi:hypothetical protein [Mycolicibacterium hodleri]|nr:hypothetical protein [Mycolicibacterium hodleri]
MTEIPRDPTNHDVVLIPVEQVQLGFSLLIDEGQGPQVFHVDNVRFRSLQGADGSYVGTYLMTAERGEDADPWKVEYAAGTQVSRIM